MNSFLLLFLTSLHQNFMSRIGIYPKFLDKWISFPLADLDCRQPNYAFFLYVYIYSLPCFFYFLSLDHQADALGSKIGYAKYVVSPKELVSRFSRVSYISEHLKVCGLDILDDMFTEYIKRITYSPYQLYADVNRIWGENSSITHLFLENPKWLRKTK